jgi:hypothetical protein
VRSHTLLRDLERRFDGDMPDGLRRAALAGGEAALLSAAMRANSRCIDRLALSAVRAAAARRGSEDLAFWRREGLDWMLRNILYADIIAR